MGDLDLRFYLSIFWRRSPYFVAVAAVISILALIVAYSLPEIYRASAKILVEAPQIPSELARSTVSTNTIDQLQIVQEQATTSDNLLALAQKLEVYGDKTDTLSREDIVDDMRARVSFEQLAPSPSQEATVVEVAFKAGDPLLAANVVNELVASILGKNARQRTDRAGDTLQFFEGDVARLKAELAKIEADMLKFKNENRDTLPDSLEFRRSQRVSEQERLLMLDREEAELRNRRSNLIRTFETTGAVTRSGPVTPEQQLLQDLNRALSDQLTIFSEQSPNIQGLRKRVAALQASLRAKQAADDGTQAKEPLSEMDLLLSDIDERLRSIAKQKPAISRSLDELARTIAATPRNETILNAFERNRANIQSQYNAAVARLAEASTGQEIEMRSKGVRFSILEPATPPERRLSPDRRRILGVAGLGAAGLGLGLIVLLEMLNKTIRRPIELAQMLQIQPLATIPYIASPAEPRSGNMGRLFGILLGLAVAAALISLIRYLGALEILHDRLLAMLASGNPI